jgi:hypothetical protein
MTLMLKTTVFLPVALVTKMALSSNVAIRKRDLLWMGMMGLTLAVTAVAGGCVLLTTRLNAPPAKRGKVVFLSIVVTRSLLLMARFLAVTLSLMPMWGSVMLPWTTTVIRTLMADALNHKLRSRKGESLSLCDGRTAGSALMDLVDLVDLKIQRGQQNEEPT